MIINISLSLSGYENRSLYSTEDELISETIESIRTGNLEIKTLIEDAASKWRTE